MSSGLTFGGLSRRQQCEAATLIFAGVLSTGLAIAMLVGTMTGTAPNPAAIEARTSRVGDVTLPREAADTPLATETGTRSVMRFSVARAASRRRPEAPRLVLASVSQPVAVPRPDARADSSRSRFARLLFGDGARHVVRPFPVIEATTADAR